MSVRFLSLSWMACWALAAACVAQNVAPKAGQKPPSDTSTTPTTPAEAKTPKRPRTKLEALSDRLNASAVEVQVAAVDEVKSMVGRLNKSDVAGVKRLPAVKVLPHCLNTLMSLKRFDDVETMALIGISYAPAATQYVAKLQKCRVEAFIAAGKGEAALSAAKAYYNVVGMGETDSAVDLMGTALFNARPNEKGIAVRFKKQQLSLASTGPADSSAGDAGAGGETGVGENLLRSIVVDPKPFEEMIQRIQFDDYGKLIAKGNLLLLSDKAKEARACFESAEALTNEDKELAVVTESVARSIRAETGAIAPANRYILARQSK